MWRSAKLGIDAQDEHVTLPLEPAQGEKSRHRGRHGAHLNLRRPGLFLSMLTQHST